MWPVRNRPKKIDGSDFDSDDALAQAKALRRSMDEAMDEMMDELRAEMRRSLKVPKQPRRTISISEQRERDMCWSIFTLQWPLIWIAAVIGRE